MPSSRNRTSKGTVILSLLVVFAFIGVLFDAVNVYVLPTGSYDSTGPYDTLQCADTTGRVFAFGGSPAPYSSSLATPITVYSTGMQNAIGSCIDTLNINLNVKSGTVQGYSTTCTVSAFLNGTFVKSAQCNSGVVTGIVGSTVSPVQLTVSGFDLYSRMVGNYLNKSGTLAFSVYGSLTVYFLQGCGSPPCPTTRSFSSTVLSALSVSLTTSGTVAVNSVSGGSQFIRTATTQGGGQTQAGFGFRYCPQGSSC